MNFKRKFSTSWSIITVLKISWVTVFLGVAEQAYAQVNEFGQQSVLADTISESEWSEETYFWIEMLRLRRWLSEVGQEVFDSALLKEVAQLIKEAETFAADGDYTTGLLWLETVWELIQPVSETNNLEVEEVPEIEFISDIENNINQKAAKKFNWSREIITGIDLWRQEYEFVFFDGDSTFLEGNGNPYTGLRLNFDYGTSYKNSLQGYTFFKYSRDYLSGEASFRLVKPLNNSSFWTLENRFEGTSFFRDFDLKYLQNASSLEFDIRRLGPFSLLLEDEFILRRYANERSTYPNYFNNTLSGFAKLAMGFNTLVGVSYQNILRFHPNFNENDYHEDRVNFNFFQSLGRSVSLSLENELRFRNYTNIPTDTSFQFDYWEEYLRGVLRLAFNPSFGTEIQGSITKRDYQLQSPTTPDYLLWEVEPEFYFNITSEWRLSVGFYSSNQTHEKFFNRLTAISPDVALSIRFEDYYSYGPTLTIELFKINGLIFSLRESFLLERYPNALTRNVQRFNLYSDRNINSILLFLNWDVTSHWQVGVLANMDDDRSQKDDSGDSQNTLVALELNYSF